MCSGGDSNPHASRRYHLKVVSLPISPPEHCSFKLHQYTKKLELVEFFAAYEADSVVSSADSVIISSAGTKSADDAKNPTKFRILRRISRVTFSRMK